MTSNVTPQNKGFKSVVVTKCLTTDCKDCTGSYINRILGHRLICTCGCGHITNVDTSSIHAVTPRSETAMAARRDLGLTNHTKIVTG